MIALIAETGSKTIVTSRDKETATFENKRANKTASPSAPARSRPRENALETARERVSERASLCVFFRRALKIPEKVRRAAISDTRRDGVAGRTRRDWAADGL